MRVMVRKPRDGVQEYIVVPKSTTGLPPIVLRGTMQGTLNAELAETIALVDSKERPRAVEPAPTPG